MIIAENELFKKNKTLISQGFSGERGIRTPGPVTVNGFQDRRIRPLCHLSGAKIGLKGIASKYNLEFAQIVFLAFRKS